MPLKIKTRKFIRLFLILLTLTIATRIAKVLDHYYSLQKRLPALPCLDYSGIPGSMDFNSKVWLHRVNSAERAQLMASGYDGMEIDVMFDSLKNNFDVGHPPTPSIGLRLDSMLSCIPDAPNHCFWLDYKNLSTTDSAAACAHLLAICKKYRIANTHFIIESDKPELLKLFAEKGFYTAYLIPSFDMANTGKEELEKHYLEIKKMLEHNRVHALSAPSRNWPFIKRYFPQMNTLLWYPEDHKGLSYYATLAYLRTQRKVKVVLVNEMSAAYR